MASPLQYGITQAVDFLRSIGLRIRVIDAPVSGFIDGVKLYRGGLIVGSNARVSNLLHEAGHLAIFPGNFRDMISGNVDRAVNRMFAKLEPIRDPDSPLSRAAIQASDTEATAWAWAAGIHLGLEPEAIIMDGEYSASGAFMRMTLRNRAYAGINGLQHGGMCRLKEYPTMIRWLQPHFPDDLSTPSPETHGFVGSLGQAS